MAKRNTPIVFLLGVVTALAIGATVAPAANASPMWKFGGKSLETIETVIGDASKSALTIPSLTTTCKNIHYKMKIFNSGGTGQGDINEVLFEECSTGSACAVGSITAEKLPWHLHLTTLTPSDYVILEGVKATILYEGEECVLAETPVTITGTAGGLFENLTSTMVFNASTFKTTKTELKALGTKVEWSGLFSTEATGLHIGQSLSVS